MASRLHDKMCCAGQNCPSPSQRRGGRRRGRLRTISAMPSGALALATLLTQTQSVKSSTESHLLLLGRQLFASSIVTTKCCIRKSKGNLERTVGTNKWYTVVKKKMIGDSLYNYTYNFERSGNVRSFAQLDVRVVVLSATSCTANCTRLSIVNQSGIIYFGAKVKWIHS